MTHDGRSRVAFVAGAGHSGSTLVSFVLNTHPDLFAIGEMHAPVFPRDRPDERMCSCGSPMTRCPFFAEVAGAMTERGFPFDPVVWDLQFQMSRNPWIDRLLTGSLRASGAESMRDAVLGLFPPYRRARRRLEAVNVAFVETTLALSGKTVFVDANKDPIRIGFLRRIPDYDLAVIHLVRDPRGYAYSRMRDKGITAAQAADSWKRTNTNVERLLADFPANSRTLLRYERLCENPGDTLRELGRFLGVGAIEVPEDFRASSHHIMGNKMRLPSSEPSTIRLDEKWRGKLNEEHLASIRSVTGSLAAKYGYRL